MIRFLPRHSLLFLLGLLIALLLIACNSGRNLIVLAPASPLSTPPSAAPSDIAFPTDPTAEAYTLRDQMEAELAGTLALVHGCLGVTNNYAADGILVIWPPEYVLDATSDPVAIRDRASGELLARLGDEVSLGGGHVYLGQARDIAGDSLPDACAVPVAQSDNFFVAAPNMRINGQAVSAAAPFPTVTLTTSGEPTRPLQARERELSPRGDWAAEVRTDWPTDSSTPLDGFYAELRVTSADDSTEYLPLAEQRNYGLGYITPGIVGWSPSGRYLYFTERPQPDGCAVFADASGLWRLDVQDGAIESLLDSSSSARLSPDGLQVAYTLSGSSELTLLDLRSGDRRRVELEMNPQSDAAGAIVWSPDSQRLAVTIAHDPCLPGRWTHAIVTVDISADTSAEAPSPSTLLARNERLFTTESWREPSEIQLRDENGQPWAIDSLSGELTPAAIPVVYAEPEPLHFSRASLAGYSLETNVLVEPPLPVAHKIPTDLCAIPLVGRSCAEVMEQYQLEQGVPQIERQGEEVDGTLRLMLLNGDVATFANADRAKGAALYSYLAYLPQLHHHLLWVGYYEGWEFLLIHERTGDVTVVNSAPTVSPDDTRFFTTYNLFGSPLYVTIWQTTDGDLVPEQTLRFAMPGGSGPLGPIASATWADANRIEIVTDDVDYLDAPGGTIAVELLDDETVRTTFNGVEMERAVLDAVEANYENTGVGGIEAATVGSLVYIDRDYVFTSLPDFLLEQPYLRFFNDNMHRTDADYARLHLYQPATLYAAIDADACALPGWLSAWEPVGDVVETSDLPLALYRHDFAAGEVVLGGNEMSPAACVRSHYVIFVVANDKS